MFLVLLLATVAFFASLMLTPAVRSLALRWNILDYPSERKIHLCPMPRVGGVAIVLAYFAAFGALLFEGRHGSLMSQWSIAVSPLLAAVITIFVIGLLDDLHGLTHWQKLAGQLAAAGAAYWAGIRIAGPHGNTAHWWSLPATVGWLLLCTNAMNLIDGVDGLAAGVGLLATTTAFLVAMLQGNIQLALLTVPLIGALFGFLRFNFNPATIFLGDSGSLFIGFLLGCYGVLWGQKSTSLLGSIAPLMALSIPLLDTVIAMARRLSHNRSIFEADRAHLHHRLLDRGLTPRRATLLLYSFCALGSVVSILMTRNNYASVAIVLIVIAAWFGFRHYSRERSVLAAGTFGASFLGRKRRGNEAIALLERWLGAPEGAGIRGHAKFPQKDALGPARKSQIFRVVTGAQAIRKTKA
jgi:UDP-GlcNAc:undecaprenyl-phosphate GlcNAc-1-phosphate transferase